MSDATKSKGLDLSESLEPDQIASWVVEILMDHDIYPVGCRERVWPESIYMGRCRRDVLQIRISDHPKRYPSKIEIDFIIDGPMTRQRVLDRLDEVLVRFNREEDELARIEGCYWAE